MIILDNVITDRGSKYAVSGGPCHSADEARTFLAELKRNKRFAKATHNSWGLICGEQMIKNDDGEAGAGMVILRMLEGKDCGTTSSLSQGGSAASTSAATASGMCRKR